GRGGQRHVRRHPHGGADGALAPAPPGEAEQRERPPSREGRGGSERRRRGRRTASGRRQALRRDELRRRARGTSGRRTPETPVPAPSPSNGNGRPSQTRRTSHVHTYKNGTRKEVLEDGTTTISFPNGDRKRTYANEKEGIVVYYYAETKVSFLPFWTWRASSRLRSHISDACFLSPPLRHPFASADYAGDPPGRDADVPLPQQADREPLRGRQEGGDIPRRDGEMDLGRHK
ncbi:hypothetical protein THAOC_14297, partial [Thalassiosira oceanica]